MKTLVTFDKPSEVRVVAAKMGKSTELIQLLKTGNSDAARKVIAKMKKSGE